MRGERDIRRDHPEVFTSIFEGPLPLGEPEMMPDSNPCIGLISLHIFFLSSQP